MRTLSILWSILLVVGTASCTADSNDPTAPESSIQLAIVEGSSEFEVGDRELLVTGRISFDFVGEGIPRLFVHGGSSNSLLLVAFVNYSDQANNGVTLQLGISGPSCRGFHAKDVVYTVAAPSETQFMNARAFDKDGNAIYKFGVVRCTAESIDNYRMVQMRRPNTDPFDIEIRVYGNIP